MLSNYFCLFADSHFNHEAEINTESSSSSVLAEPEPEPEPEFEELPNITDALKKYYRDYFSDWFEPNQQLNRIEGGIKRYLLTSLVAELGIDMLFVCS